MRALVIEDDPSLARLIKLLLIKEGFEVVVAGSVLEALEEADRSMPELITLDLLLPDGSGYDVLLELRKKPYGKNILVMVVSVFTDQKNGASDLKNFAQGYLIKPFKVKNFKYTLQKILEEDQYLRN